MLEFFRKYQWYFFLVITIVIIISFSFFGTYSALSDSSPRDEVAFTTVNGTKVSRLELEEAALFLGTDIYDKQAFGGAWGPNFFNDGVIRKDFLETGLAVVLAEHHSRLLASDLQKRLEKEKKYTPYTHPQAAFVGAETVWGYFAPQIKEGVTAMRQATDATTPEAFNDRIRLFLAEKEFPSAKLRHVLHFQQKQYSWLPPDENLQYRDLSLFGYHTTEDWFGQRFVRLIAECIINSAEIAERRGYTVSKDEALADLMRQTDLSYQQTMAEQSSMGVATKEEFYREQLRRMGMDQAALVRIWRQVLLFRRLFHDEGNSVYVDSLVFKQFNAYAKQSINADLYRLPKALQLANYRDLQRFEIYLQAVTGKHHLLELPNTYLSATEVAKEYPELVQKRYLLSVSEVDKHALQLRVPVKETWNWEVEDKNWETLKKQFPELGVKQARTREERFKVLDALDAPTRSRVDLYARKAIVDLHPEWLENALKEAKPKQLAVGIQLRGGELPFAGVEDRAEFMQLLDRGDSKLANYTADQNKYYRIAVLEKWSNPVVLTFEEASQHATLDPVVRRVLDNYYTEIREENPSTFQRADQSWKTIDEVQDLVADRYLGSLLKAVWEDYLTTFPPNQKPLNDPKGDFLATLRFYHHMRKAQKALQTGAPNAAALYSEVKPSASPDSPIPQKSTDNPKERLAAQWKLERSHYQGNKGDKNGGLIDPEETFSLAEGAWSSVNTPPNGDLSFIQIKKKGVEEAREEQLAQMQYAQQKLSADAQCALLQSLLEKMPTPTQPQEQDEEP